MCVCFWDPGLGFCKVSSLAEELRLSGAAKTPVRLEYRCIALLYSELQRETGVAASATVFYNTSLGGGCDEEGHFCTCYLSCELTGLLRSALTYGQRSLRQQEGLQTLKLTSEESGASSLHEDCWWSTLGFLRAVDVTWNPLPPLHTHLDPCFFEEGGLRLAVMAVQL